MTNSDLNNFAAETNNLLGSGSVVKTKLFPNVYFEFEMSSIENAIKVELLWKKSFSKLDVLRTGKKVMAA